MRLSRTLFLVLISLSALAGCGGNESTPTAQSTRPQTEPTRDVQNHVLDFGTVDAVITGGADESRPNVIASSDLDGIQAMRQSLRFNSGDATALYLDPELNTGFCSSPYPKLEFTLMKDGTGRVMREQVRMPLVPNTDYTVQVRVLSTTCDSIEVRFGLRGLGE